MQKPESGARSDVPGYSYMQSKAALGRQELRRYALERERERDEVLRKYRGELWAFGKYIGEKKKLRPRWTVWRRKNEEGIFAEKSRGGLAN